MNILDCDAFDIANRALDAYPEPAPFDDFGPYRILRTLGSGGMGEVFLGDDVTAGRHVALKFLAYAWRTPALRERFDKEVKTLAKLEHPFIARLYDTGLHPNGTPYFAMEFVEGQPLDEYCRQRPAEECLRLFRSVCAAVQYAHVHLVVHRDLKPSNILVTADGTPRLLDFGVAKQLEEPGKQPPPFQTELGFTRAYAAPEQLRREPIGVYTDVYALGVIFYELLAGKSPYELGNCTPAEAEVIVTGPQEPAKPSASPTRAVAPKNAWGDLDVLCLKAMRKDPAKRYHSVLELMQDVDRFLEGKPLSARPDALSYRATKFVKRNRRPVITAALAFAAAAALILFFTLSLAKERDRAVRETAATAAMNRFLSDDLLGRSDPFKSGKSQESFTDVVDRASSQIDKQFATEPLLAARLHATVAKAFDNRSDFARARSQYDRADRLFEKSEGPSSQDATALRLQWAVMEAMSGEPGSVAKAQSLVRQAKSAMSRPVKPRDDLPVWLLYAQGAIAIAQNDAQAASKDFSEALEKAHAPGAIDPAAQTSMQQMVAFSYVRLGEGAKAEPLLREVIAAYSKRDGTNNPSTLRAHAYLAQALLVEGKYPDAIEEVDAVYPMLLEKLGADHQITLAALGTRAAAEGYLGEWDAASRDDLAMHDDAVRKQGPSSLMAIESLTDAALSQCYAHHYSDGESNAREAYENARRAFGPRAAITGGTSFSLATCQIGLNRLDEAAELLRNIDANAVSQLSGDPTVTASIAVAQAQIALRRRDFDSAEQYVHIATPVFEHATGHATDKAALQELRTALDSHRSSAHSFAQSANRQPAIR